MPRLFDDLTSVACPKPRPYQSKLDAEIKLAFETHRSTLATLATGLGKTVLFGLLAQWWLDTYPESRVLVLAHRDELIRQAKDELAGIIGFKPDVEQAELYASTRGSHPSRCVVASVQSLTPKRLERFDKSKYSLVIVDECHHCVESSSTYWRIWEHFSESKWLGVTATAERGDKIPLGSTFESICPGYGIAEGVAEGYLVEVEQEFVRVKSLDLSTVDTVKGEFNQRQLGVTMTEDMRVSWEIAAAVVEKCQDEPTLIFVCPRPKGVPVGQGDQIVEALNSMRPSSAVFLTGEHHPDDRKRQLDRFEAGEYPYLVGCSLFTEGFNCPKIANVVMARMTKSIVYYTQAIGRGTRTLRGLLKPEHDLWTAEERRALIAASAKPRLRVLDFVGNSGKHKLISCIDIFAGNPAIEARAKKVAKEGQSQSVMEEVKKAKQEQAAEDRKVRVRAKVVVDTERIDPFGYTDSLARGKVKKNRQAQAGSDLREWIEGHGGLKCPRNMTVQQGQSAVAEIKDRWKKKLCSPKQEMALRSLGLAHGALPRSHASALLDLASHLGMPWGKMRPIKRLDMSIAKTDSGFQLRIEWEGVKYPVGGTFPSADHVRDAYAGLVAEPAMV